MSALWVALIVAAVAGYLLKLAGVSLPGSALAHPKVKAVAFYLPIAMLSALALTQLVGVTDRGSIPYRLDWRVLAGVVAGVIALLAKRGVLVVFVAAVAVTALLRLLT
ncbi:MAG: AzlD domain-containing protein [Propionibacteriaceae bacterium]